MTAGSVHRGQIALLRGCGFRRELCVELAARSGISVETIRAIEQGKHPNLEFPTVARWARVVGASLEEWEALSVGKPTSGGQE